VELPGAGINDARAASANPRAIGLYGLLAGDDRIAEYRLKMNVRLTNLPPLARFGDPVLPKPCSREQLTRQS